MNNNKGFTLLEVVISLGIVMAIIGAISGIQLLVKQTYLFSFNASVTLNQANSVAGQVIKALRNSQPADNGAYMLETVDDQEVGFYANVDDDEAVEKVRYFLQGEELKRGLIEPVGFPVDYPQANEKVKTLSEHVQNGSGAVFYYYNQDWPTDTVNNPLAQADRLSQTRFIKVSLKINADPDRPEGEYILEPTVSIRNLKENL